MGGSAPPKRRAPIKGTWEGAIQDDLDALITISFSLCFEQSLVLFGDLFALADLFNTPPHTTAKLKVADWRNSWLCGRAWVLPHAPVAPQRSGLRMPPTPCGPGRNPFAQPVCLDVIRCDTA